MEKLKQLKGKGSKNKYDVDELENVYDTVDEKEYTDRVLQRQEDDWIEDGALYRTITECNDLSFIIVIISLK